MKFNVGSEGIRVTVLSVPSREQYDSVMTSLYAENKDIPDNGILYYNEYDIVYELKRCFLGGRQPQCLESLYFTFLVEGISLTTTHQLVRTRIGANFSQMSQRANDVSDSDFTVPETVMIKGFYQEFKEKIEECRNLYKRMIESGIPYQDARYIMNEGINSHIVLNYSYPTLLNTYKQRICNGSQWEINSVFRLIKKELINYCDEKEDEILNCLIENLNKPCINGKCFSNGKLFPKCGKDLGKSLFPNSMNPNSKEFNM